MPESRAKKLSRLVRVQRQIERMAENELSHTLREQVATEATQNALVDAVGSFNPVHAAMSHQYALRFQRLSAKLQQLSGIKSVHERRVLTEKTKADRLSDQAGRPPGARNGWRPTRRCWICWRRRLAAVGAAQGQRKLHRPHCRTIFRQSRRGKLFVHTNGNRYHS